MKPKQLECGTMSLDVLLSYNFMLNLLSSSVTSAANELAATLNIAAPWFHHARKSWNVTFFRSYLISIWLLSLASGMLTSPRSIKKCFPNISITMDTNGHVLRKAQTMQIVQFKFAFNVWQHSLFLPCQACDKRLRGTIAHDSIDKAMKHRFWHCGTFQKSKMESHKCRDLADKI